MEHPFKSIAKLNTLPLQAGDGVYLNASDIFQGSIYIDSTKSGTADNPITISSYGDGVAVIDGGNENGLTVYGSSFVNISNLSLKGNGRKSGNTKDGVTISNCKNITTKNLEVTGFQKSGLLVYASVNISNVNVYAHNNGSAGITVEGDFSNKLTSRNITFTECRAVNNPGDPTNLTNHSGNGIVVGHCTNVLIDKCMASDNGWDMPRIGNGPVGIWAYEADSVVIQRCLSFHNKTAPKAADGGGFDLDGGVTNSVIQYCYSYENQGAGYCMFQYWGASPWHDNVIRFNISENDGTVSDAHGGAYVWNSSGGDNQFYNSWFYNNTIYNSREAALSYSEKSSRKNFKFINNIFIGRDSLIRGEKGEDTFLGNDWWGLINRFKADTITDFESWAKKYNVESIAGKVIGLNISPAFDNNSDAEITSADDLSQFFKYKLPAKSLLKVSGIDLITTYNIQTGGIDFLGNPAPMNGIGACF
ncbi:MAG: right-handed parallel beta-helix repeat-containing protein [Bacteroidetes bacterium]|nr:right-handed parallel beta-helix repeat-containing protein [Bacteroidota bacterium]